MATREPLSIPKVRPATIVLSSINLPTFFSVILASIYLNISVLHTNYFQHHSQQLLALLTASLVP